MFGRAKCVFAVDVVLLVDDGVCCCLVVVVLCVCARQPHPQPGGMSACRMYIQVSGWKRCRASSASSVVCVSVCSCKV